jgi:type II secretory pathway component PulC
MSIIHDALKKVQQGRNPKTPSTPETDYLYDTLSPDQKAEQADQASIKNNAPKPSVVKKINSLLAMLCAILITIAIFGFIFQQFRQDIPKFTKWIRVSYCQLLHKKILPDFQTRAPEDLKPLAQLTVSAPAASNTAKTPPPLTLNIHGVMANDSGNLVLINDRVYQEGDTVEGAKIVKINLDSITIINDGKEETISVGKK